MREALDPWFFIHAAYLVGVGGTALMIGWSLAAMRSAERRRERSREK
jgi:hypothetical protein